MNCALLSRFLPTLSKQLKSRSLGYEIEINDESSRAMSLNEERDQSNITSEIVPEL